jgi:3-phenylpropionate/trans-cinnamate dioxygenase ferredoxin reductase component
MTKQTFVIVGASLAGAEAAETLREEGFDGRVVVIGEEPERPYERPPLSKDYLRGEAEAKPYVHDESFYAENEIELRISTPVERIDPGTSQISLSGGENLGFDRLLTEPGRGDGPCPAATYGVSSTCARSLTPRRFASASTPAEGS